MNPIFIELNEIISNTKFKPLNFVELLRNIELLDKNDFPTKKGFKKGVLNVEDKLMFSVQFQKAFDLTYEIERRHFRFSSKVQKNWKYCNNFLFILNTIYKLLNKGNKKDNDPDFSNEELDALIYKEKRKTVPINKIQEIGQIPDDKFTRR